MSSIGDARKSARESISPAPADAIETIGPPGGFYIPSLDGIRALSFLLVFLSHTGLGDTVPGGFGVSVFFLLSGFLITTLLRREYKKSGNISFRGFYFRRLFRILPPLYVALLFGIGLTLFNKVEPGLPLLGTLLQVLQVSNYYQIFGRGPILPGSEVLWSLAIEEHFYLIFPVLYLWMCRRFSPIMQSRLLLSLCAVVLFWRFLLRYGFHASINRTFFATDTRFDSILFGCVFAIIANPTLHDPWSRIIIKQIKWLLPASFALLLFTFLVRNDNFRETLRYSLQAIALIPVFIAAIHFTRWRAMQLLNLPWLRFLGVLSYSLYLVHFMVLKFLTDTSNLGPFMHGLAALLISLVVATLIHYGVERPMLKVRKRFERAFA